MITHLYLKRIIQRKYFLFACLFQTGRKETSSNAQEFTFLSIQIMFSMSTSCLCSPAADSSPCGLLPRTLCLSQHSGPAGEQNRPGMLNTSWGVTELFSHWGFEQLGLPESSLLQHFSVPYTLLVATLPFLMLQCKQDEYFGAVKLLYNQTTSVTSSLLGILSLLKGIMQPGHLCWQSSQPQMEPPHWIPFTTSSLWDVNSGILPLFKTMETCFF